MNKIKKKLFLLLLTSALLLTAGCRQLDVIGNTSVRSLDEVLAVVPAGEQAGYWSLESPDGDAAFLWSRSFAPDQAYTAMLQVALQPFVDAGLDPNRLPGDLLQGDLLVMGTRLETGAQADSSGPLASYEHILWNNPDAIGHHMAMDHFGINLGGGHQFEWARDMAENDKDIVFVLDPAVFAEAGADLDNIAGWAYDEVETMDEKGNMVVVEKLLKPFDLR